MATKDASPGAAKDEKEGVDEAIFDRYGHYVPPNFERAGANRVAVPTLQCSRLLCLPHSFMTMTITCAWSTLLEHQASLRIQIQILLSSRLCSAPSRHLCSGAHLLTSSGACGAERQHKQRCGHHVMFTLHRTNPEDLAEFGGGHMLYFYFLRYLGLLFFILAVAIGVPAALLFVFQGSFYNKPYGLAITTLGHYGPLFTNVRSYASADNTGSEHRL